VAAVVGLMASVGFAAPSAAQEADPDDVASIDAILEAYYDVISGPAGAPVDVARDQSLRHPEAWVAIANVDAAGTQSVIVQTLDDYHAPSSAGPRSEPFYECSRRVRTASPSGGTALSGG
jgi:hypothetical protein